MVLPPDEPQDTTRRNLLTSGAALLGSALLASAATAGNEPARVQAITGPGPTPPAPPLTLALTAQATPAAVVAPEAPPGGYNILFILVDQEHYFEQWPFPVPARESIKKKAITFTNHQAAACVCSSARSVIYTGHHIQQTGIGDNLNYLWQKDLSTTIKTIGTRLSELGYHAAYQGKWHLSYNMDEAKKVVDVPLKKYQQIIERYGFKDYFGVGDLTDGELGGYTYDDITTSSAITWLRTEALALRAKGQPWYLAVNFVNPHDVMYFNSDLPNENVQSRKHAMPISRAPSDTLYAATWDHVPLPATRSQSFEEFGRPRGHKLYQQTQNIMVGAWPNEDRRWRALRDFYFNCIRDCDRQLERVLQALSDNGMDKNTIVIFTSDHGELGGSHQMRGKGVSTYRQQNHLPLMIHHPAYPGGTECAAVTSQLDLAPTILGLTGKDISARTKSSEGLKGRDFSGLLNNPQLAKADTLRPAALFNYDMLSYQDPSWAVMTIDSAPYTTMTTAQQIQDLEKHPPNFKNRISIRSIWDGQYRFSRYFSPVQFNMPNTLGELFANNDLEVYDTRADPEELINLAVNPKKNEDVILALNQVLNTRIYEEVGVDDGSFLPIRNGKWNLPAQSDR